MSNPRPKKILLDVAGQKLKVMTDLEESYVQRIAAYLDRRIGAVQKSGNVGISQKTILLAALDLAEEVISLNHQLNELRFRNDSNKKSDSDPLTVSDKLGYE